jgi:hypothetical protein
MVVERLKAKALVAGLQPAGHLTFSLLALRKNKQKSCLLNTGFGLGADLLSFVSPKESSQRKDYFLCLDLACRRPYFSLLRQKKVAREKIIFCA